MINASIRWESFVLMKWLNIKLSQIKEHFNEKQFRSTFTVVYYWFSFGNWCVDWIFAPNRETICRNARKNAIMTSNKCGHWIRFAVWMIDFKLWHYFNPKLSGSISQFVNSFTIIRNLKNTVNTSIRIDSMTNNNHFSSSILNQKFPMEFPKFSKKNGPIQKIV